VAFVASSSRGLKHPGNNSSSHISSAPGHPILEANQSRSFSLKSFLTPAASTSGNNATSERQLRASRHVLLQADSLAGGAARGEESRTVRSHSFSSHLGAVTDVVKLLAQHSVQLR